ncbi:kelch repeat-containing protein [Planctomycetota bacterium]
MAAPSAAAGTTVLNGLIIYFGGETAISSIDKTTWAFDPKTSSWTTLGQMIQGRHGSQAVTYDGRIYISAGSPNRGGGRVNTTEMFSTFPPPPIGRRR